MFFLGSVTVWCSESRHRHNRWLADLEHDRPLPHRDAARLSPLLTLSDMTLSFGGNKTLHITAQNLGDASYLVQSVKVSRQAWNKSWISHSDIVGGRGQSTIEFELGSQKTEWDVGLLLPSPGHHGL